MYLRSLTTHAFRNLANATVEFSPALNIVLGPNGAGKSSLLEAYGVLATARSFRSSSMRPVVRHGEGVFRVAGLVVNGNESLALEQVVEVHPRVRRTVALNGAEISIDDYLAVLPIAVLTGGDRDLVFGPPEERRSFLDRVTFLLDSRFVRWLRLYNHALQQRNAALSDNQTSQLAVWDEQLARLAGFVLERRCQTVFALRPRFEALVCRLAEKGLTGLEFEYRGELAEEECSDAEMVAQRYEMEYHRTRERDLALGFTSLGPHRHDLALTSHGRRARDVLSSGQGKLAAAALRLSAIELLENRSEGADTVPVLMDDADAELDPNAFRSVLERLGRRRQIILSSAHPEVVRGVAGQTRVLWIEDGELAREGTAEQTS